MAETKESSNEGTFDNEAIRRQFIRRTGGTDELSPKDFKALLVEVLKEHGNIAWGNFPPGKDLEAAFKLADANKNGFIDEDEFIHIYEIANRGGLAGLGKNPRSSAGKAAKAQFELEYICAKQGLPPPPPPPLLEKKSSIFSFSSSSKKLAAAELESNEAAETVDSRSLLTAESLSSGEVGFILKLLHRAQLPENTSETALQQCATLLEISISNLKLVTHRSAHGAAQEIHELKSSKPSQRPSMFSRKPSKAATAPAGAAVTGGALLAFVVTTSSEEAAKEMAKLIPLRVATLLDPLVFGEVILEGDILLSTQLEAANANQEYKVEGNDEDSRQEKSAAVAAVSDSMPGAAEASPLGAAEQETKDNQKEDSQDNETIPVETDGVQNNDDDPLSTLSASRISIEPMNLLDDDKAEENSTRNTDDPGTPRATHSKEPLNVDLEDAPMSVLGSTVANKAHGERVGERTDTSTPPEIFDWTTELSLAMDRKITYLRSTLPAYDHQAPRHLRVGTHARVLGEGELLGQPPGSRSSSNGIIVALLLAAGIYPPAQSATEAAAIADAAAFHRQQVVRMLRRHARRYAPSVLALHSLEGEGTMRANKWVSSDNNGGKQDSLRFDDQCRRGSGVDALTMTAAERAQYDARCLALTAAPSGASAAFRDAEFQASADVLGAAVVVDTIVVRTGATSRVVFEPWPEARSNNDDSSGAKQTLSYNQDVNAKPARLLICKCALNPTTVEAVLSPAPKKIATTDKESAQGYDSVASEERNVLPSIVSAKVIAAKSVEGESGRIAAIDSQNVISGSSDSTGTTNAGDDKWVFDRLKMTALYEVHEPSKVPSVEALLIKYDGKHDAMWDKLLEKYGEAALATATAEAQRRLVALTPLDSSPEAAPREKVEKPENDFMAKSEKPTSPPVKKIKKSKPIEVKKFEPETPRKFRNNLEKKKIEEEEARFKMKFDFERRLAAKNKAKKDDSKAPNSPNKSSPHKVLDPAAEKRQAKKAVDAAKAAADASAQKAARFRRIANKANVDVEHAGVVSNSTKSQALRVKAAEAEEDAQRMEEDARILAEEAAEMADFVYKNGKLPTTSSNAPPVHSPAPVESNNRSSGGATTAASIPADALTIPLDLLPSKESKQIDLVPSEDLRKAKDTSKGGSGTERERPYEFFKVQVDRGGALAQKEPTAAAAAASSIGPTSNDGSEQPTVVARSGPAPLSRLWRGNKKDIQSSSSNGNNSSSSSRSSSGSSEIRSSSKNRRSKTTNKHKEQPQQLKERLKEAKKRAEEQETLKKMEAQAQAEIAAELAAFGGVWPLSAFDVNTGLPLPKHLRGPLVPTQAASRHSTPSQLAASAEIVDRLLHTLATAPPPPPEMGVLWFVPDTLAPWRSDHHRQLDARLDRALTANKYHHVKANARAKAMQEQQQQHVAHGPGTLDSEGGFLPQSSSLSSSPYADGSNSSSTDARSLTPLFHLPRRKQSWAEYMAQRSTQDQQPAARSRGGSAESRDFDSSRSCDRDNKLHPGLGTAI